MKHNHKNGSSQILESLIDKLEIHHNDVTKDEINYKALESPVQGPDRSRLTLFVEGQLHIDILL